MDYQKAIEQLEAAALKSEIDNEMERWSLFVEAREKLETWVESGSKGECPVDLRKLDVDIKENAETTLEAKENIEEEKSNEKPTPEVKEKPSTHETFSENSSQALELVTEEENPTKNSGLDDDSSSQKEWNGEEGEKPIDLSLLITPEEQLLFRQLDQAREHLKKGDLRAAVALSNQIVKRTEDSRLRAGAEDLLEQAKKELRAVVQNELKAGEEALESDREAAQTHFEKVLEIEPKNEQALQALVQIKREGAAELTENAAKTLKSGLLDRKDLKRLDKAVREAEALDAEGTLSSEMVAVLREARPALDQMRILQGETTTLMRYGDLAARKKARDRIANDVAASHRSYYDAAVDQIKDAFELLQEADKLLEEASEDTANYLLAVVQRALPAHPKLAKKRMMEALEKPFHEQQQRALNEKLLEVEQLVAGQEKAEELAEQALNEQDAVGAFQLFLRAYEAFPHLSGLESSLNKARLSAAEVLATQIQEGHKLARIIFETAVNLEGEGRYRRFQEARDLVNKANRLSSCWPEKEKPSVLQDLIADGQVLIKEIEAGEKQVREFSQMAGEIRDRVIDPNNRQSGLDLFAKLSADQRFVDLPDMKILTAEMDQYRDIADLLKELDAADAIEDWNRVKDLTTKILETGKVGKFEGHVRELRTKSTIELRIINARQLLEQEEIKEAHEIISFLINNETEPRKRTLLAERLKTEQEKIDRAISENPPMQELYDQARTNQGKNDLSSQMMALRMFRYVGGDIKQKEGDEWPEYRLSLRTTDARREERLLAASIREKYLPKIRAAYKTRGEKEIDDQTLLNLSETAWALWMAYLVESDEREMIRWVEWVWGKRQADAKEAAGNWGESVVILTRLNNQFPHQPEIEARLRRAAIQKTCELARLQRGQGHPDQAVETLTNALADNLTSHSYELHLALAEAHLENRDYDRSMGSIGDAERTGASAELVYQKQVELRAQNALNKSSGGAIEALTLLQRTINAPDTIDKSPFVKQRDSIFEKQEEELLSRAQDEEKKGNDEGKINAVKALFELQKLEEIILKQEIDRRSIPELSKLREDLGMVAEAVVREAAGFDPALMDLEKAVNETEDLFNRLDIFCKVAKVYGMDLGEVVERLNHRRRAVETLRTRISDLTELIEKANSESIWLSALQKDDFVELDLISKQMRVLDLDDLESVKGFYDKLSEWKDIHSFLSLKITEIKRNYFEDQNFSQVISLLKETALRPDAKKIRQSKRDWRFIHDEDYTLIRDVMSSKLRTMDVYMDINDRGELIGWDSVENAAKANLAEQEAWEKWFGELEILMDQGQTALNLTNRHTIEMPLVERRRDWINVEKAASSAHTLIADGPQMESRVDGRPAPIHSDRANEISEIGRKSLATTELWINKASRQINQCNEEIGQRGGFPSAEDFSSAATQNDRERLRRLLERARSIGAIDEQQEKQIRVYTNVLRTPQKDEISTGFVGKLKQIIRRE